MRINHFSERFKNSKKISLKHFDLVVMVDISTKG